MYTIEEVSEIIRADQEIIVDPGVVIKDLIYDSRKILQANNSLFFAFKGIRDGHLFIKDAYAKGIKNFVISNQHLNILTYPDANFLIVSDVLLAIQDLAAYHRKTFKHTVTGITGSNGKTVVKEWLGQLLSDKFNVYQSPKSYNSQLGVALSLWNLSNEYDLALIEAGISQEGEMDALEKMIRPEVGIFTSIGQAHASGFSSKERKIQEKMSLFAHSDKLIYPSENISSHFVPYNAVSFSWGLNKSDTLQVLEIDHSKIDKTLLRFRYEENVYQLLIPFADRASVENCLTCVSTLLSFGYSFEQIQSKIITLKPVEMRLQLKQGKNNTSIIDDSYSNDLASLQIGLEFLNQQQQHAKKTLILSEMEGLKDSQKMQDKLLKLLHQQNLSMLIFVGDRQLINPESLSYSFLQYNDTKSLVADLPKLAFANESILIKGSRQFHLEDLSKHLVAKSHETKLEINLKALEHNLQVYRKLLPKDVKLMAMVKAFSYGSGGVEVANTLQFNHVDYLTVAFADEGVELRTAGIKTPIMVMSPDESTFETLLTYELEPEIYSFSILESFIDFLVAKGRKAFPIHIKVDTGMHRLGFLAEEVKPLLVLLKKSKEIRVKSVFSHLAAAGEDSERIFSKMQIESLTTFANTLEKALGYSLLKHIANTAAIVKWPEANLDMVRLGIGMYGIDTTHSNLGLEQVNTLKTTVTQLKELDESETVGYDRRGKLFRPSRIATVKIGYADGYDRRFGNGVGKMKIAGQEVSTIGNICMDMTMLDVTDIQVSEGDEVLVYPDISKAASSIGTIPYELLVTISSRVKRIYYYE
ncbi:bifunctional UDP-N-acetylmuramoyl-tripeptide:D-alanyl-D-alanine ligase/alanine racemase [Sphingobacterium hungaricum]|uniref:Alanine racemase n=1 Tax=Sphingobacterium hungaricum TaxID=2082723 RepID=A0A928V1M4_9SPHI|nr:bifunctional UDP-N-acetylmuramoyl-tripeptide:D-alanyl-D-alanine ligase/alanine racemase [Sphingobacterium hungaricum]MBE8714857.1 bifunctional UDP-N-acetylmuramoyl-tripeptide:D-alanyl-D-alanine ligase/alanine racemase [Sphingobacterium hungaricum]